MHKMCCTIKTNTANIKQIMNKANESETADFVPCFYITHCRLPANDSAAISCLPELQLS